MNKQILKDTIAQLFASSKGLLAMDESTSTCNKRFAAAGIPQTVEMRRKKGINKEKDWNDLYKRYKEKYAALANEYELLVSGKLPEGWK